MSGDEKYCPCVFTQQCSSSPIFHIAVPQRKSLKCSDAVQPPTWQLQHQSQLDPSFHEPTRHVLAPAPKY